MYHYYQQIHIYLYDYLNLFVCLFFQSRRKPPVKKQRKGDLDDLKQELDIDHHKISVEELYQRFGTHPETVKKYSLYMFIITINNNIRFIDPIHKIYIWTKKKSPKHLKTILFCAIFKYIMHPMSNNNIIIFCFLTKKLGSQISPFYGLFQQ